MALYRTISMSFWTDSKVVDDFTPEDRYFYLYLFTNPHTNLCGCYEISKRQMIYETGYSKDTVETLIKRLSTVHDVIRYSCETKEILLLNWHKYNWTSSEKFRKPLVREIAEVKDNKFRSYLESIFNGETSLCIDTVSDNGRYGIYTPVANTNTNTVSVANTNANKKKSTKSYEKEFDEIWELYPKKQGKSKAKEKYIKARKEGTTKEEVENGIKNYVKYIEATRTEDQYIKHGSTYFNNRCWLDEYTIKSGKDALRAWAEGDSNGQKTDSDIIDVSAEFIS